MSRIETLAEGITLYLGDCREVLPTLPKVDAVVTDPPYGIGAGTGIGKVTKEGSDFRGCSQWDESAPPQGLLDEIRAIAKYQIIFGGNYFALPPSKCFLIWDKIQPEQFSLAMAEQAWTNLDMPAKIFRWKSMSINGGAPKYHPTQKPIDLMGWCIEKLPAGCNHILDPFMGSGTTGIAAAKLGRRFTGIEVDHKYFDIACHRINEALKQPDLFIASPPPSEQYNFDDDLAKSVQVGLQHVRERKAAGGPDWNPK
jgi:site-specific DNA-methyltransferase (adenine-specific)/modification methylase